MFPKPSWYTITECFNRHPSGFFSPWKKVYFEVTEQYFALFKPSSRNKAETLIYRILLKHVLGIITIGRAPNNAIIQYESTSSSLSHENLEGIQIETPDGKILFRTVPKESSTLYHLWQTLLIKTRSVNVPDCSNSPRQDEMDSFTVHIATCPSSTGPNTTPLSRSSSYLLKSHPLLSNSSTPLSEKSSIRSVMDISASCYCIADSNCSSPATSKMLLDPCSNSPVKHMTKWELLHGFDHMNETHAVGNKISRLELQTSGTTAYEQHVKRVALLAHTNAYAQSHRSIPMHHDNTDVEVQEPVESVMPIITDSNVKDSCSSVITIDCTPREVSAEDSVISGLSVRKSTRASFFAPSQSPLNTYSTSINSAENRDQTSPSSPTLSATSSFRILTTSTTSFTLGNRSPTANKNLSPVFDEYNTRLSLLTGSAHRSAKRVFVHERRSIQLGNDQALLLTSPPPPPPLHRSSASLSTAPSAVSSTSSSARCSWSDQYRTEKPKLFFGQFDATAPVQSSSLPFSPVSQAPMHHFLRPEDHFFPIGKTLNTATMREANLPIYPSSVVDPQGAAESSLSRSGSSPYLAYGLSKTHSVMNDDAYAL